MLRAKRAARTDRRAERSTHARRASLTTRRSRWSLTTPRKKKKGCPQQERHHERRELQEAHGQGARARRPGARGARDAAHVSAAAVRPRARLGFTSGARRPPQRGVQHAVQRADGPPRPSELFLRRDAKGEQRARGQRQKTRRAGERRLRDDARRCAWRGRVFEQFVEKFRRNSGPGSAGDADVRLARELLRAQGAAAGDLRVNRCPRGGVAVRALPEGSRADVRRGRAEFRGDLRRDARGLRRGCSAETASRRTPAALRRGSLRGDVSGLSDAGATSRCRRCPTARRVRRF